MNKIKYLISSLFLLSVPFLYNNCGSPMEASDYIQSFGTSSFEDNNNSDSDSIIPQLPDNLGTVVDEDYKQLRLQAKEALAELEPGVDYDELYQKFNNFALLHYNTKRSPLLKYKFGDNVTISDQSRWTYSSLNSVAISFQTNLPVKSKVILKKPNGEEIQSKVSERYFYTHLHHLSNLNPGSNYSYYIEMEDDSGNILKSPNYTISTKTQSDEILITDVSSPPITLDQEGATYILTKDITSSNTAINIIKNNITLDLNGHKATFATSHSNSIDNDSAENAYMGVRVVYPVNNGIKILNGKIVEGRGDNEGYKYGGLNPIFTRNVGNLEIAGVSVDFHGAQTYAMWIYYPHSSVNIHHNTILDRGWNIKNRHGASGGRSIYIKDTGSQSAIKNDYKISYNLVKRSRQNGITRASKMNNNEIYIDSWSTNAFAIQPHSQVGVSAGEVRNNKIFLTGYHAIATGWAHDDLEFNNNFIHMEGIKTNGRRWYESFGDQDSLNGIRVTNYSPGGQVRNNLQYTNNLIIGFASGGTQMRGTELFSDYSITNTLLQNNIIRLIAEDSETTRITPIVTQGTYSTREDHKPIEYKNMLLSSNIANIRFGDSYGRGNQHHFYNCILRKLDNNPNYHTIIFDGGYNSGEHLIIDPIVEGGASLDDVHWKRTSVLSFFSVGWSLKINAPKGSTVKIYDKDSSLIQESIVSSEGSYNSYLKAYTVRPSEWYEGIPQSEVQKRFDIQKIQHGPYRVVVNGDLEKIIYPTEKTTINY